MKRIALLTVLAAFAVMSTVASAAVARRAPGTSANGIIAVLIGLFTPPIGTDRVARRPLTRLLGRF
jgi:hypothetical protein